MEGLAVHKPETFHLRQVENPCSNLLPHNLDELGKKNCFLNWYISVTSNAIAKCNDELGPESILGMSTNNVYTNVTADCGNPFQL